MSETLADVIDPRRMIRATKTKVYGVDEWGDKLPPNHYMSIGSDTYYLFTQPHLDCSCPDFTIRGKVCKHLIKALMVELDPVVMKKMHQFGLQDFSDFSVGD